MDEGGIHIFAFFFLIWKWEYPTLFKNLTIHLAMYSALHPTYTMLLKEIISKGGPKMLVRGFKSKIL